MHPIVSVHLFVRLFMLNKIPIVLHWDASSSSCVLVRLCVCACIRACMLWRSDLWVVMEVKLETHRFKLFIIHEGLKSYM